MEDFAVDIVLGKGASTRSVKIPLPRFTLVGATTRAGLLTSPLRYRFGVIAHLDYYDARDLGTIVERSASILEIEVDRKGGQEIARRSRGTPRVANRLLRRVRDYAQIKGPGTINMIDGTLLIPGTFKIARDPGSVGHINLNGGTISANGFIMREREDSVGTMNVGGGMLTVNGDQISLIQEYIDNGWITTYEGNGSPNLDYNVANPGQTTLTAVHNLSPNPANRAIVKPGEVELSWTLPDPLIPGEPVPVDVYFTDDLQLLEQFTDPAAIQVVNKQNVTSVVVQTQAKTRYFWAVDAYVDSASDFPVVGPVFSFLADNAPPFVNAGPDISTFLQDGTRTGPVSGIVTDDGAIQPYTVMWSVIEQPSDADPALPSAVIADPAAEQTTVTVSAEGIYVLQLEANDGEYTSSDTMTIIVHPDDWTQ
jgi:hypothetical protein